MHIVDMACLVVDGGSVGQIDSAMVAVADGDNNKSVQLEISKAQVIISLSFALQVVVLFNQGVSIYLFLYPYLLAQNRCK